MTTAKLEPETSPLLAAPSSNELAQKAKSGVLWVAGLNLFRDVLQFGTMLVLVRLLAPEAYGQFTLITSVMGFFTVFSFRSFLEHTIQLRPHEIVDYQSHFTAAGFMQLAMCTAVNLAAAVLGHFQKYAAIAPVLHVTSFFFLLDWPSEFRARMLERELNWKRLRTLQAIGLVGNALLALGLAISGFGVYALVLPGLMTTLPFIWDLFFRAEWRPDWSWSATRYKAAWSYGWARIMSGVLTTGRPVLEGAIVVHVAGFAQLGIMGRAVGLASLCCLKVPSLLSSALYPVLTRLSRTSEAFTRGNGLLLCLVSWMVIPAAVLFSMTAPPVVRLVYGSKWDAAVPLLPYALAAGTASALYLVSTLLMLADVQHRRCAVAEACTLTGVAVGLYFVLPFGVASYLGFIAILQWCVLIWMLSLLKRTGALSFSALTRGLAAPLGCAVVAWILCTLFREIGILPPPSRLTYLAAVAPLFILTYALCLRVLCPNELRDMIHYGPLSPRIRRFVLGASHLA